MEINYIYTKKGCILMLVSLFSLVIPRGIQSQSMNGSAVPLKKIAENTVSLLYKDTLTLPSGTEFELPVRMSPSTEISAISLGFYFPDKYLEISDIYLADSAKFYHYNINDSLFQLAWSNIVPISIMAGDTLLILKMKTLDLSQLQGTIRLALYEMNEFADAEANIIDSVILEIPEIQYYRPDTIDTTTGYYLTVYPNPFKDYTTIYFGVEEPSKVSYTITDIHGMKIKETTEADYPEGEHTIRIYGSDLAKGVYFLKIKIKNSVVASEETYKLISTW